MSFAFNPDGGPARIFRYVGPTVLPLNYVAFLSKKDNVLYIVKERFDRLTETEKHLLLRTKHRENMVTREGNYTTKPMEISQ